MGFALRRLTSQTKATDGSPSEPRFAGRPAFAVGATVSHFRLLEWLGRGERGFDVYKAQDLVLGRPVALKLLASDRPLREQERQLLRREAEAVAALRHPNLCLVHEVGETPDGILFISMACCEGESLAERIARGPLEIQSAVEIAVQVAEGLACVHQAGIVHRTLKPADVLVSRDDRVWITDFGLGWLDERTLVSGVGGAEVPSRYLSPEQVRGGEADARSDVWGLGAILYEMVTGRPAFLQGPVAGAAPPAPMSELREGVSRDLQAVVSRALALRPSDRYPNAREMRTDLLGGLQTDVQTVEVQREIGPYRIGELLGGGGMGVVYRAEDRRLGRSVAIKLLPPELTRDPAAKARFLQEARAASALDHPNLCTVYEVGEAAMGQLYLAMPCYDGETLRSKIDANGPLPVAEALDIALQALKGIAKAHRHGIVHRDIKPANLMVTADGVVKILDFGIAKLARIGEEAASLTRTGACIGTPAYMSPEQSRGEEVDVRTDLWSLGVVLYEMLAGVRPSCEAGAAEPAPVRRLRPDAPSEVEGILRRLLAKDRQQRYATAEAALSDVRVLLGTTSGTSTATGELVPVARRALRLWAGAALGLVVLAIAAGYWLRWEGEEKRPSPPTFARITDQEGRELFPSLSPDGNFFVYAKVSGGSSDIYMQRIGGGNPIALTPDTPWEDTQPAYSPDGEQIAFRSEREGGGLFLMGATGESVRRLTDFGFNPSWSADGKRIVFATEGISDPASRFSISQLWIVDVASGELKRIVEEDAVQPSWSPNGHRIAYWGVPVQGGKRTISTVPADGGEPVRVTADASLSWNPVWSADGAHLYFASDRGGSMNLWRQRIDEASGRVRGEPEPVTTPSSWSAMPSPSRDGRRMLYVSDSSESNVVKMAFDPDTGRVTGAPAAVTQGSRMVDSVSVSPDGEWITFQGTAPREDLFVSRSDGSGLRQLTNDVHKDRLPRWSPDGRLIAFYSNRSGRWEIWTVRSDGGDLRQITRTAGPSLIRPIWSPDGSRLVCGMSEMGSGLVDLSLPLAERVPKPLPRIGGGVFIAGSWSPDGKWIAGWAQRPDNLPSPGIYLYSLETGRYRKLTESGSRALWAADNRHLLVWGPNTLDWVDARTGESREVGAAPPDVGRSLGLGLSPDGRTLYAVHTVEKSEVWLLTANP